MADPLNPLDPDDAEIVADELRAMGYEVEPPTSPFTRELMHELLARGVPWPMAIEAVASTRLDRDERVQTHSVRDQTRPVPSWWREDDDGVRIVDRD